MQASRLPLPVSEVAIRLGVVGQTVRNLYDAGRLEGFRVGRKILVYADSVEEFKMTNGNRRPDPPPVPARPVAQPEPEAVPVPRPTPTRRRGVRAFDRHRVP